MIVMQARCAYVSIFLKHIMEHNAFVVYICTCF